MKSCNIPIIAFVLFAVSLFFSPKVFSETSDLFRGMTVSDFIAASEDSAITFDSIKNELSSDGEWIKVKQNEIDSESVTDGSTEIDDEINTEYVWRPNNVPEDWSPYTNGYWQYSSCGWMWVSYYHWGWRPYHYGRWWWSPIWGWVWSPGYIWGPAWVVWMFYDGYCGWYPLSPRARWHHHHHWYYCGHMRFRVRHWIFCHNNNFPGVTINHTVIIDPSRNAEILEHSNFASDIDYTNGKVINKGPQVTEIEKSAGKKITPVDVSKYNNSKKVDEYVKKEVAREKTEEVQKYQDAQKKKDSRQNNEVQNKSGEKNYRSEDSRKENNSGTENNTYKEDKSYKEKPKEYEPKNETKPKNENKGNDTYKPEKKNDSQNNNNNQQKNDSYKAPEQKNDNQNINKGNDSKRSEDNSGRGNSNNDRKQNDENKDNKGNDKKGN